MVYVNDIKFSTSYSFDSKVSTSYANDAELSASFLLKEDAFYLLQEDGSKIVLFYGTDYLNDLKP